MATTSLLLAKSSRVVQIFRLTHTLPVSEPVNSASTYVLTTQFFMEPAAITLLYKPTICSCLNHYLKHFLLCHLLIMFSLIVFLFHRSQNELSAG